MGDAERAMKVARAFMPLVGWRAERVRAFLALSDVTEQIRFWRTQLNTRRFRAGFDALMSPSILFRRMLDVKRAGPPPIPIQP